MSNETKKQLRFDDGLMKASERQLRAAFKKIDGPDKATSRPWVLVPEHIPYFGDCWVLAIGADILAYFKGTNRDETGLAQPTEKAKRVQRAVNSYAATQAALDDLQAVADKALGFLNEHNIGGEYARPLCASITKANHALAGLPAPAPAGHHLVWGNSTWQAVPDAPAETVNEKLREALQDTMRYLVTPQGFPDKGKRTVEQQAAFDKARAALALAGEGKK